MLSPAQDCVYEVGVNDERNTEAELPFAEPVVGIRRYVAHVEGVTVSIRTETVGRTLQLYASVRNDSSKRYVLEWPLSCRRGRRVYVDDLTAVITRSSSSASDRSADLFSWETWQWERELDLGWILLEPGTQLTEEVRMTDPALECTREEDWRAYWGRHPSRILPFTHVLVGYEVFEFREPEFISDVTPDGNPSRRWAPERTLIIGEAAVPPVVRLVRKRNLANEVQRTWSVSTPTPYR